MKSLNNFNCHTWFVEHYVGKMEPSEPWLLLPNLNDFNQCTLMRAVSVIVIYSVSDFLLVFKLHTFLISTNLSTVIHTNLFPTNCTIDSFDAPTCFGLKPQPYSGGYSTWVYMQCIMQIVSWKLWIIYKGVIPKLINTY